MTKKIIVPTATLIEIEELREKLIEVGMDKGLCHSTTIELSRELDILLNTYNQKENTP